MSPTCLKGNLLNLATESAPPSTPNRLILKWNQKIEDFDISRFSPEKYQSRIDFDDLKIIFARLKETGYYITNPCHIRFFNCVPLLSTIFLGLLLVISIVFVSVQMGGNVLFLLLAIFGFSFLILTNIFVMPSLTCQMYRSRLRKREEAFKKKIDQLNLESLITRGMKTWVGSYGGYLMIELLNVMPQAVDFNPIPIEAKNCYSPILDPVESKNCGLQNAKNI